ncbi:putative ankyrin repeat domain-containing protein 20A2 [Caloenas nicobarica]|uniref:putative ankyrin repeat domain-containing protein 20A2 n=1 Tax=Caloenas nicobarica TaxID=187106 RepID=UPI0032B75940
MAHWQRHFPAARPRGSPNAGAAARSPGAGVPPPAVTPPSLPRRRRSVLSPPQRDRQRVCGSERRELRPARDSPLLGSSRLLNALYNCPRGARFWAALALSAPSTTVHEGLGSGLHLPSPRLLSLLSRGSAESTGRLLRLLTPERAVPSSPRSMQCFMALLRSARERPPSDSACAPSTAGASEIREKGRGGLHSAAASGDLARLQGIWWRKRFRINSRDANKQTHPVQDSPGAKPGAYADSTVSVDLRGLQKLQAAKTPCPLLCWVAGQAWLEAGTSAWAQESAVGTAARNDVFSCLVCVNWLYLISRTPLHLACANGHADVVRFLAGKKCKLNPRGMFKKTPLMLAVQHQHKDCVTALLEHGANPNHKGAGGNTALHMAAVMPSKSMVELLLEHNAHIDARNDLGYTPLAVAIIERREEMVEFLLQNGADVNARDKCQRTTLKIAAYAGNTNVARLLLQHGAVLSHHGKDDFTDMGYLDQFTSGLSKILEEYARSKRTGECSVGGTGGAAVPEISSSGTTAAPPLGAPAQIGAGALPEAGAQQEEDFDSLSDFEVPSLKTDSEGPTEVSAVVLLPPAKQQGACAQPVAEEHHNDVLPAAGAAQEEEDFDSSSLDEVCALEREELPLKKEASTQTDCQGDSQRRFTWLQQEFANTFRKYSLAEASLEAEKRYSRGLQEQKLQLQKELDSSKSQLQELQERLIRSERYAKSLENAIENKERELTASRNLQSLLVTSSGTAAIPELEERLQQLQVGMARLEATAQQQAKTIEALHKDLQASASRGSESRESKRPSEKKRQLEALPEKTRRSNGALEEEPTSLETLLEASQTKVMEYAGRKRESQPSVQRDMKKSCSEVAQQAGKQRRKVTNAVSMASHLADFHRTGDSVETTRAAGKINPGPARSFSALPGAQGEPVQNPGLGSEVIWDSLGRSQPSKAV